MDSYIESVQPLGLIKNLPKCKIYFGNRFCTLQKAELISSSKLILLKQCHSANVVESTLEEPNAQEFQLADAHWTQEKNVSLGIVTADCLPILLVDKKFSTIAAIHAGWRGLHSKIITNTLQTLVTHGISAQSLMVWIGPHIQKNSFEVGQDVLDAFKQSGRQVNHYSQKYPRTQGKYLLDLTSIAVDELQACGVDFSSIQVQPVDTFADENYYSYRREKKGGLRNISFVQLL